METRTQPIPGYYVWEIPGKTIAVHIHLDVIDRLAAEVMRGFGAVPKRGAEVGGLLLGTIEPGEPSIVRIEDFAAIECDYKRGPSYLFSDEMAAFEDAREHWMPDESRPAYAVGYFRSHTRDGFALAPEDIELLDRFFPEPLNVALLVRPYGTKVSTGGFFFRESGAFQTSTPLEFPFGRRELTGGKNLPRRPMADRRPRGRDSRGPLSAALRDFSPSDFQDESSPDYQDANPSWSQPSAPYTVTTPSRARVRSWVWIPLSFIFLLLGVLLGFQTALSVIPKISGNTARDFSLGLSVAGSDNNLSVRWDREAPAIRVAQRGILEIEDGSFAKAVDLDPAQLQNGNLIYRNSANDVKLRLIVYPRARVSVSESTEWKR